MFELTNEFQQKLDTWITCEPNFTDQCPECGHIADTDLFANIGKCPKCKVLLNFNESDELEIIEE